MESQIRQVLHAEIKFLPTPAPWLYPEKVLGGGLAQHLSIRYSLSIRQDESRTTMPSPVRNGTH